MNLNETEKIKEKQIYACTICTDFSISSCLPVSEELKLKETEKVAGKMLGMGSFTNE